ncbi:MAG: hypothetical protein AAF346_04880 [Pseudomonadota bacterium]
MDLLTSPELRALGLPGVVIGALMYGITTLWRDHTRLWEARMTDHKEVVAAFQDSQDKVSDTLQQVTTAVGQLADRIERLRG